MCVYIYIYTHIIVHVRPPVQADPKGGVLWRGTDGHLCQGRTRSDWLGSREWARFNADYGQSTNQGYASSDQDGPIPSHHPSPPSGSSCMRLCQFSRKPLRTLVCLLVQGLFLLFRCFCVLLFYYLFKGFRGFPGLQPPDGPCVAPRSPPRE